MTETDSQAAQISMAVAKPIPYTFDLGNLLCNDSNNAAAAPSEAELAAISRDCAQALINQILTTCTITHSGTEGTLVQLPPCSTPLPRENPLPKPKTETTWERFARKKGIQSKKRSEGKMVYDDTAKDWVPKWGYKGRNKAEESEWLVEVDEKKEAKLKDGETIRGTARRERKEQVRRNESRSRTNVNKSRR